MTFFHFSNRPPAASALMRMALIADLVQEGQYSITWRETKLSRYRASSQKKQMDVKLTPEISCTISYYLDQIATSREPGGDASRPAALTKKLSNLRLDLVVKRADLPGNASSASTVIEATKDGNYKRMTRVDGQENSWTVTWGTFVTSCCGHPTNTCRHCGNQFGVENSFDILIIFVDSGDDDEARTTPGQRNVISYMEKLLTDQTQADVTFKFRGNTILHIYSFVNCLLMFVSL